MDLQKSMGAPIKAAERPWPILWSKSITIGDLECFCSKWLQQPCTDRILRRMYLMISCDKIAFRTDLKLILNMDSTIDKENIKGEINVLTRKRIMGPGINNINLSLQAEPTKEESDDEKTENMIGDQAMVPPSIAFFCQLNIIT